jgi:hypothetical protein
VSAPAGAGDSASAGRHGSELAGSSGGAPGPWRRRAPAMIGLAVVAIAIAAAVLTTVARSPARPERRASAPVRRPPPPASVPPAPRRNSSAAPSALAFRPTGARLPVALAGSAGAPTGADSALLLGGVESSGAPSDRAVQIAAGQVASQARVSTPLRYAAAASIAGTVYLFGGERTQPSAAILQVDPMGGTQMVGQLPTPVAEAGVAVVAGTAYIVGGTDGSHPLSSIVAWGPGLSAHIVAELPQGLRFPAVAPVAGQVIVAGGSTSHGASRGVLGFDPTSQQVTGLTVLPTPISHASAAVLDGRMYVLGGQTGGPGTQTDHIENYDPQSASVSPAGLLPSPLSDAVAVSLGRSILLAGGVDDAGQSHDQIYEAASDAAGAST